jgi:aspartate aminotransferase
MNSDRREAPGQFRLAARAQALDASRTGAVHVEARRLRDLGVDIVDLSVGELDCDTSDVVKRGAYEAIRAGRNGYTDAIGIGELRDKIAENLIDDTGRPATRDEVALTAGAKQALFNAAMVLLDAGDEAVVPAPYWTTFTAQVELVGARPVLVDTSRSGYQLDVSAMRAAITPATRILVVNTPHNPTGAVYSRDAIRDVVELAVRHDLYVVFDQCYDEFIYGDEKPVQIWTLHPRARDHVLVVGSFSKTLALTGWRLGFLAGPERIIRAVRGVQSHTTSNPNVIAQYAVLAALESGTADFVGRMKARLESNRALVLEHLGDIDDVVLAVPQGGFFAYFQVTRDSGHEPSPDTIASADWIARRLLDEAHVATVAGSAFGDPYGIRLSMAIDPGRFAIAIRRVRDVLKGLASRLPESAVRQQDVH